MRTLKKRSVIRSIAALLLLLIVYLAQDTFFSRVTIFGVKPLILPLAVIGIAIISGTVHGGVFGILAGMLCDLSFNQPTILFTLLLTFIGIYVGLLADTVLVKNYLTYLLASVVSLLLIGFVQIFPFLFFKGVAADVLMDVVMRQTLCSLIFTLPMYYLLKFTSRYL